MLTVPQPMALCNQGVFDLRMHFALRFCILQTYAPYGV